MQKKRVLELAMDIFSGFTFRTKVEEQPGGDLAVVQLKDMENGYSGIRKNLTLVNGENVSNKFYLQRGDILFIAKGANNYAVEYDLDLAKAIAVSAFFIIRPDVSIVLPAYLAWYINQAPVQQYLKGNMAGTYIPNINKSTVEQITVAVPSMAIQEKIAVIDRLNRRESFLMTELSRKREAMVHNCLLQVAISHDA